METANQSPVALVAGITGGVGAACAEKLALKGFRIVGFARDEARLQELSAKHPEYTVFAADARDPAALEGVVAATLERHGQIDSYIHALGSIILKAAHQLSDEEWLATFRQNVDSAFYALRACIKPMSKNGGSLVFFSSAAARVGLPNHEAIAAAKAAIEGLVRSAAATYASRGIRVNAIAPGMIESNLSSKILANENARQSSVAMHPLGRIGQPEDVATIACLLASGETSWVSGQVWSVDGGLAELRSRPRA